MLTEHDLITLLATNDKAVGRALVALYKRQTADEQSEGDTKHQNGMGFNSADGRAGTKWAKFFELHGYLPEHVLSEWRWHRLLKYTGQLLKVAAEKEAAKLLQQLEQESA